MRASWILAILKYHDNYTTKKDTMYWDTHGYQGNQYSRAHRMREWATATGLGDTPVIKDLYRTPGGMWDPDVRKWYTHKGYTSLQNAIVLSKVTLGRCTYFVAGCAVPSSPSGSYIAVPMRTSDKSKTLLYDHREVTSFFAPTREIGLLEEYTVPISLFDLVLEETYGPL